MWTDSHLWLLGVREKGTERPICPPHLCEGVGGLGW